MDEKLDARRVVVSGSMYRWRLAMSSVPQEAILKQVLFNILINDINSGIKCTLIKFADDTKLCGRHAQGTGCQPEIPRQAEQWVQMRLVRFSKSKCKVLNLDHGNSYYLYKLGDVRVEHGPDEKDIRVLMDGKLEINQQCALEDQKAN